MSKVVFITGASSGLGSGLAKLYAENGAAVVLAARRGDRIEALAEAIQRAGGTALPILCDVANQAQVHDAVKQCEATLGPVDVMIANAGVAHRTRAIGFDASAVKKTFDVNLLGVAYCFEAVLPGMIERDEGKLVGISSLAAYRGVPGAVAYCASKAALNNMLESLRVELYKTGVHITTICPGYVKTEMTAENNTPMPFLLEVDDAAKRIFHAIERTKSEYAFPFPMSALTRFARYIPNAVYDRLVGYFSI